MAIRKTVMRVEVQIDKPTVLWESIAPCTLPTYNEKAESQQDAMTSNLPKLLLVIVIREFLLSWLLVTAGPRISSAKFHMDDG
jgi:hypothetical protein